jgi:N-acetyl-alpha-D-muramate 1-phosphate uridylyltransferase
MTKITQSFIFAAGRGERMRPITDNIPKPLVQINNKSIIDYSIEKLSKISSINKIIINGFYLADKLENHIKNLNNDKIIFSCELEKIETGGGLLFAKDKINFDEPLLTINGDILWQDKTGFNDIDLICNSWKKFQKDSDYDILLGLKKTNEYQGYDKNIYGGGDFNLMKNGNLQKLENSEMSHAFIGVQIINPKVLLENFVGDFGKCFSLSKIYKNLVLRNSRIKGVEMQGQYFHIGDVEAVSKTQELLSLSSTTN